MDTCCPLQRPQYIGDRVSSHGGFGAGVIWDALAYTPVDKTFKQETQGPFRLLGPLPDRTELGLYA